MSKQTSTINTDEELLNYLNNQLAQYDALIKEINTTKDSIDEAIIRQEENIVAYENQKIECDAKIVTCEQNKAYTNILIAMVEAV
jgi:hypothetical protein